MGTGACLVQPCNLQGSVRNQAGVGYVCPCCIPSVCTQLVAVHRPSNFLINLTVFCSHLCYCLQKHPITTHSTVPHLVKSYFNLFLNPLPLLLQDILNSHCLFTSSLSVLIFLILSVLHLPRLHFRSCSEFTTNVMFKMLEFGMELNALVFA